MATQLETAAEEEVSTVWHPSLNIAKILEWEDLLVAELLDHPTARRPMTAAEVRAKLLEFQAEGKKFVPSGNGPPCRGWSDQTGCPNHQGKYTPTPEELKYYGP